MKTTSVLLHERLACPNCTSSDAFHIWQDDGEKLHGYCFSCLIWVSNSDCQKYILEEGLTDLATCGIIDTLSKPKVDPSSYPWDNSSVIPSHNIRKTPQVNLREPMFTKEYVGMRGIPKDVYEFYGTYALVDEAGIPNYLVYPWGGGALKKRNLSSKEFLWENYSEDTPPLFGMDRFNAGSAKSITVTEGEDDAAAAYYMLGSKWPCVSVKSAGQAVNDCKKAFEYLNSFEKIYLCFDNDKPGQEALAKVAKLFNPNKVHVVQLTKHKDARDYLVNNDKDEFTRTWWNARKFIPKQILGSWNEMDAVLMKDGTKPIANYPFPTLNSMTKGIRPREVTLYLAPEKIGKTELFRSIEYNILKNNPELNVGIIHLEENEQRTLQGLLTYESKVPVHLHDSGVSKERQVALLHEVTQRDDRLYVYSHFGSDDPNVILDHVRLMVTVLGCKVIFLDHLSMLVTGIESEDERRTLDYLATRFAVMVNELDFSLHVISHINDNGRPRGSRAIAQLANTIITLNRDKEHDDPTIRNLTNLTVQGNRHAGLTGPAGRLLFDPTTFVLTEYEEVVGDFKPGF